MKTNLIITEKIKSIFLDYAQGIEWLEISKDELDIIAKRIEVEVMEIQYEALTETETSLSGICGACGGDASDCDGC